MHVGVGGGDDRWVQMGGNDNIGLMHVYVW